MSARQQLDLDIELKSPLVVGDRKSTGYYLESMKYVPGRVIRGAIAAALLSDVSHDLKRCDGECDFCALFVDDSGVIFRNAWPRSSEGLGRPLLASAMRCKMDSSHASFDTLIDRIACLLTGALFNPRCPVCNERTERDAGYCVASDQGLRRINSASGVQLTRVGIDRARRAAADEILYSLVALREVTDDTPTRFHSTLDCPQHLAESLESLLNSGRICSLGGATSRGLGSVNLTATMTTVAPRSIGSRVDTFNDQLGKALEGQSNGGIVPRRDVISRIGSDVGARIRRREAAFFTVDLLADSVLVDPEMQIADFVLDADALKRAAGCDGDVDLVWCSASPATRTGWNATWGLPRMAQTVSAGGGVFVYYTPQRSRWVDALNRLECSGVGERVLEGFGQIEICSSVHERMKGASKK